MRTTALLRWRGVRIPGAVPPAPSPLRCCNRAPELPRLRWPVQSSPARGTLLILISFITNYGESNLLRFSHLPLHEQVGISLHNAALAALVGEIELASRLRDRARNRVLEDDRECLPCCAMPIPPLRHHPPPTPLESSPGPADRRVQLLNPVRG